MNRRGRRSTRRPTHATPMFGKTRRVGAAQGLLAGGLILSQPMSSLILRHGGAPPPRTPKNKNPGWAAGVPRRPDG
jgi:hypothetical protein